MRTPTRNTASAADRKKVVGLLLDYVERLRNHFAATAESFDLTMVQAKVLMSMDEPTPMHHIAQCLSCDPSNVTGVVDRLQDRGLLSRSEAPEDRRIKFLQLTAAGKKMREALRSAVYSDVPGIRGLSGMELAAVQRSLSLLMRES